MDILRNTNHNDTGNQWIVSGNQLETSFSNTNSLICHPHHQDQLSIYKIVPERGGIFKFCPRMVYCK